MLAVITWPEHLKGLHARIINQPAENVFNTEIVESGENLVLNGDNLDFRTHLEYLRGQIDAECISTGELIELQGLVSHIDKGDVQLLEWAGVPEFEDEEG